MTVQVRSIVEIPNALELRAELAKAHEIILAMLNRMDTGQKMGAAADLERQGISGDGLTRYHERLAVLKRAGYVPPALRPQRTKRDD